uniref:Uncharacterized protein n=1 Tax=Anguilla anguilla TaxID=7936 RepID=A0A0E9RAR7_ANGAN
MEPPASCNPGNPTYPNCNSTRLTVSLHCKHIVGYLRFKSGSIKPNLYLW